MSKTAGLKIVFRRIGGRIVPIRARPEFTRFGKHPPELKKMQEGFDKARSEARKAFRKAKTKKEFQTANRLESIYAKLRKKWLKERGKLPLS